jgi:RNA polymerase sigma factor (sigma-70 family)
MVNGNVSSTNSPAEPEFLGWLFDRHAAALELYARQLCNCPEDVVQEALMELARAAKVPDNPVAWLYQVVRRGAISAVRSAQRRKHHETIAAGQHVVWFERSVADRIDAGVAAAAIESLSIELREVVVARIWGGLTFEQIGQLVGVSDSAAHRRYEAAMLALRQKLRVPCPKND